MANRQWLERVWAAVVRSGLPPEYASRLLEELRDHAAELGEHLTPGAEVEDRLGDPDAVAANAVREYRAGTFTGRHPVLSFVVAPLFGVVFAWNVYIIAGTELVESFGGMESAFAIGLSHVLTWLSGFVVPAVAVAVLWRMHRRSGRPRGWFAVGGALVAVLAGLFFAEFTPPNDDAEANLIIEFHFAQSWVQAVQFAAATALAIRLATDPARRPNRPIAVC